MPLIVMLEDDRDRIARFQSMLTDPTVNGSLTVSRTAYDFINSYETSNSTPDLIALDHDLFTDRPDDPDPGDGRDVAAYLASKQPVCPVLIHSTNAPAAESMLFTLDEVGWTVDRISPLGEDWIEAYWYPYMKRMLQS